MGVAPEVSVIVPIRNGERTLARCLASLARQTHPSYEVIAVDNASTDTTPEIIRRFAAADPRIRYAYEPRRTRGAARNRGIDETGGRIIAMTDADCIVPTDWLVTLTAPITKGEERIVMGSQVTRQVSCWARITQEENDRHVARLRHGSHIGFFDSKSFAMDGTLMRGLRFDPRFRATEDFELFLRFKGRIPIRFVPEAPVEHLHRTTLAGLARESFEKGYWHMRSLLLHRRELGRSDPEIDRLSWDDIVGKPFKGLVRIGRRPWREHVYQAVTGLSWRCGAVAAIAGGRP
ncbi:glycosyltransferase [Candidatus Woesearchaeota archaeon]|nr:glycosyltransferase [Candidatus Woesearchaeota archaeon]